MFLSFLYLSFNQRKTGLIYIVIVFVFLISGYAVIHNWGNKYFEIRTAQQEMISWVIDTIIITIVSFTLVVVVNQFYQSFSKLIFNLEEKNKRLAESERSYREIFNSTADAIFIHDMNGGILDVNDAMLLMYGYNRREISSITLDELSSLKGENDEKNVFVYFQEVMNHGTSVFDWYAKRKDGTTFWVEVALKIALIGGKERVLALVRNNDEKKRTALQLQLYKEKLEDLVVERTNALKEANEELLLTNSSLFAKNEELSTAYERLANTQERMIQIEKMASLGLLATGVAHEINNPLNFIQGGLIGLQEYFKNNYDIYPKHIGDLLFAIEEGIKRSASIVESLGYFGKDWDDQRIVKCNMHNVIDHCLTILQNQHEGRIKIVKKCEREILSINCNQGKLHQVFLNILVNAMQAIEGEINGEICIESKVQKGSLSIIISDNGYGMDQETLKNVTEPFFTTKPPGEATGLGMSIASNIIEEHHGNLFIESKLNKGTKVTVKLPLVD